MKNQRPQAAVAQLPSSGQPHPAAKKVIADLPVLTSVGLSKIYGRRTPDSAKNQVFPFEVCTLLMQKIKIRDALTA
jgi:hypothetical protein